MHTQVNPIANTLADQVSWKLGWKPYVKSKWTNSGLMWVINLSNVGYLWYAIDHAISTFSRMSLVSVKRGFLTTESDLQPFSICYYTNDWGVNERHTAPPSMRLASGTPRKLNAKA